MEKPTKQDSIEFHKFFKKNRLKIGKDIIKIPSTKERNF
jgi:hypothetical protein